MNNLVLITSVICISSGPLSYTNVRSFYSHDERFEQTKKTIKTVKEKIPNSKIFIVECSNLNKEQSDYLIKNSDYFLNLYNDEGIRISVCGISKSLAEGTMTYNALKFIFKNNIQFDKLIKISGRYWLSENFNYNKFDNNNIIIKYIENNIDNVFTALYQLPKKSVKNLELFIESKFNDMINCIGFEVLFAIFIKSEKDFVIHLEPIGLEGFVSISANEFYSG